MTAPLIDPVTDIVISFASGIAGQAIYDAGKKIFAERIKTPPEDSLITYEPPLNTLKICEPQTVKKTQKMGEVYTVTKGRAHLLNDLGRIEFTPYGEWA